MSERSYLIGPDGKQYDAGRQPDGSFSLTIPEGVTSGTLVVVGEPVAGAMDLAYLDWAQCDPVSYEVTVGTEP